MNTSINPVVWSKLPTGSANALRAGLVAKITGLKTRQALSMQIIKEHKAGFPICSNGRGYFRPQDSAELKRYINSRKRRAKHLAEGTAQLIQVLNSEVSKL